MHVLPVLDESRKQRNPFPLRTVSSLKSSPCPCILLTTLWFLVSVPLPSLKVAESDISEVILFAFLGLQKDGEKQVIHQAIFSAQQMPALLGKDLINDVYIIITEFQYIVFDVYNHR